MLEKVTTFFQNGKFLDFYQLLAVDMDTSEEEIKKNYYRLSKIYHPDFMSGMEDNDMMGKLSIAYAVLKDPMMRSIYNVYYVDFQLLHKKQSTESTMKQSDSTSSNQFSSAEKEVDIHSTDDQVQPTNVSAIRKDSNESSSKSDIRSTKRGGTSYRFKVSPNVIRNTLRRCNYSEEAIHSFLLWCQKNHVEIANGKELHSSFSKYLSFSKRSVKSMHRGPENICSQSTMECNRFEKAGAKNMKRKKMNDNATSNFLFYHELKACKEFIKEHYMSSIRNLQVFDFQSFMTVIHTIQNATIFFDENRNHDKKSTVNVKIKNYKKVS